MPPEFFAGILDRDGMRRRMLARLGPDAADPLDEFLELALAYDDRAAPSLSGFLGWLRRSEPQVQRDMEHGRNEVRVMTVHGAKGLEAPIVFLHTCSTSGAKASLVQLAGSPDPLDQEQPFVWPVRGPARGGSGDGARRARRAERRERDRLLYVAMTRARDRLYVAGFEGARGRNEGCWYDLVWDGLHPALTETIGADGEKVWRCVGRSRKRPTGARRTISSSGTRRQCCRTGLGGRRRATQTRGRRFRPRGLRATTCGQPAAAARRADRERGGAGPCVLARGAGRPARVAHASPAAAPAGAAAAGMGRGRRGAARAPRRRLAPDIRASIATETLGVLRHPEYAPLFGPESRAEVPIVAAIPIPPSPAAACSDQRPGRPACVDRAGHRDRRLQDEPAGPRTLAEVPEAYVVQLAAYRLALQHAFPGRTVRAALFGRTALASWRSRPHTDRVGSGLWERAAASP